jgi:hypothetical protein
VDCDSKGVAQCERSKETCAKEAPECRKRMHRCKVRAERSAGAVLVQCSWCSGCSGCSWCSWPSLLLPPATNTNAPPARWSGLPASPSRRSSRTSTKRTWSQAPRCRTGAQWLRPSSRSRCYGGGSGQSGSVCQRPASPPALQSSRCRTLTLPHPPHPPAPPRTLAHTSLGGAVPPRCLCAALTPLFPPLLIHPGQALSHCRPSPFSLLPSPFSSHLHPCPAGVALQQGLRRPQAAQLPLVDLLSEGNVSGLVNSLAAPIAHLLPTPTPAQPGPLPLAIGQLQLQLPREGEGLG